MNIPTLSDLKIFTDSQTRRLYATDASMYEEMPQGVAFPKNVNDIQALVQQANHDHFTITPRSAGTSLAGQTTGEGIIMDVSRFMHHILELHPNQKWAHVQPGVIRDTLNRHAGQHQLLFGPDTATTNRCMLGGMIGNNSCGSFSIKHKTTREHILEIEAVLSDGSIAHFKPLSPEELEQKKQLDTLEGDIYRGMLELVASHREQILQAYPHPEIIRRNTGYALDKLCSMQPFDPPAGGRPFNLAELLCGSEGTLAITASAKIQLVPADPHRVILTPHFDSIKASMEATVEIVKHHPAAVELVDDIILNATKGNIEQRKNRFFLDGEPKCILIIQLEGQNLQKLQQKAEQLKTKLRQLNHGHSTPIISNPEKIDRVWDLRKAGLGLLMGLGADEQSPSFCEDTAVRVQDLPDYVVDFKKMLDKYNTHCVFYAHASVGELHLRPVVDIQSPEGIKKMKAMASDIADLVHKYRGSLSGEHGDGRARAPYIEKVLGKEMIPLLRKVKNIWDPKHIFNPGKILDPKPIEQDLRPMPSVLQEPTDTYFNWRKEGGFNQALELCNGAGVCRKLAESGGSMCPSYMATREEKDSTRGRANLFRQLFAGKGPDAFASEELHDALDLCLSCKACKSECPANVDMARMKAEFMQGWHEKEGTSLTEHFFAKAGSLYPLASILPRLTNGFMQSPVGKELLYQFLNIHKERTLPAFADTPFQHWFKKRKSRLQSSQKVVLLVDIFTNYHDPDIAKAAVTVLEALGYQVIVPSIMELGRPQLSKGLVKQAKKIATQNIPVLSAYVEKDIPIVGLEPSEILTLRDEYLDLCEDDLLKKAQKVADNSFMFAPFFAQALSHQPQKKALFNAQGQTIRLHGHCHAKALVGDVPILEALKLAGYQAQRLDTGCCGMAGSFGYEANHYDLSMDIGELVLFPALRQQDHQTGICAPGFSCRHQIADGAAQKAYHPAQWLAKALQ